MARFLIDTDGVIDFYKGYQPTIQLIGSFLEQGFELCTTSIVIGEIHSGLDPKSGSLIEPFLKAMSFLFDDPTSARQAGQWRYMYGKKGKQLAITDCLNAAIACTNHAILVTRNVKDYPMPEVSLMPLPKPF